MEIEAGGTTVENQSKFRSSLGYRRPIVKVIVIIIIIKMKFYRFSAFWLRSSVKMKFTGKMDAFDHQKSSYLIS